MLTVRGAHDPAWIMNGIWDPSKEPPEFQAMLQPPCNLELADYRRNMAIFLKGLKGNVPVAYTPVANALFGKGMQKVSASTGMCASYLSAGSARHCHFIRPFSSP
jgi:hypothetical protein